MPFECLCSTGGRGESNERPEPCREYPCSLWKSQARPRLALQRFPGFVPLKGRVYLRLASHLPGNHYFQQAYDILASANSQDASRNSSAIALLQADAARGLNDQEHFASLLTQGVQLALQIGSKRRLSEAHAVFSSIPQAWQKEQRIITLGRELFAPSASIIGA